MVDFEKLGDFSISKLQYDGFRACVVQRKYDGVRVQVVKSHDEVILFTSHHGRQISQSRATTIFRASMLAVWMAS
jgi:ATP-dependent DNA ligase